MELSEIAENSGPIAKVRFLRNNHLLKNLKHLSESPWIHTTACQKYRFILSKQLQLVLTIIRTYCFELGKYRSSNII